MPCLHHSQSHSLIWRSHVHVLCCLIWQTDILKVTRPPKIQIALPNLATARDGRVSFYGYDVSVEWLVAYSTANWLWEWGPLDRNVDDLSRATAAMKLLRMNTRIAGLRFESALKEPGVDAVTTPGSKGLPGDVRVPLISIFSDERPSYRKRPSQEQVDLLSEIIGKQPRWWADYEDPETYGD